MISWSDILSQYQFPSNSYEEHSDPSNLQNFFVDVIPKYPFPAHHPTTNCLMAHWYHNVLLIILPSDDMLYVFPVLVIFTYIFSHYTGRQCIYFSKIHCFLSLYNHSNFLKIHMHNTWLMGKTDTTMNLPVKYFVSPKQLFVFFVATLICMKSVMNKMPIILITIHFSLLLHI